MADVNGPERHQCEATTARGRQCLRQAMHHVDAKQFLCQQHWEQHMDRLGFRLS